MLDQQCWASLPNYALFLGVQKNAPRKNLPEKNPPRKLPPGNMPPRKISPPKIVARKNALQENCSPDNFPAKSCLTRFLLLLTLSYRCSF